MIRGNGWSRAPLVSALLLLSAGLVHGGGDGLLFYEDDGEIVITNTPSHADARPVPGFEAPRRTAPRGTAPRASMRRTIYDPYIERIAAENGLAPSLVKAVAAVESGFDPHAVSSKGAQGLMQLMPATAQSYGVDDAFDPVQNLRAGARHLRKLLDQFDGDLQLALAAYNAGAGAVRRHGGVPAYRETQEYVRKVQTQLGQRSPIRRRPAPPARKVRMLQAADGTLRLVN